MFIVIVNWRQMPEQCCQTDSFHKLVTPPPPNSILRKFVVHRSRSRPASTSNENHRRRRYSSSTSPSSLRRKSQHYVNTVSSLYLVQVFLSTPLLFSMPGCADRRQSLLKIPLRTLYKMGYTTEELFLMKEYQAMPCKEMMLQLMM